MKIYLDTSSLVKLYHNEIDSNKVIDNIRNAEEIVLSEVAILEFPSALWKKVREGQLKEAIAIGFIDCFKQDFNNFIWIKIDTQLINIASNLIMKYGSKGLRTLDSIQLASGLSLKDQNYFIMTSDKLLKTFFLEERAEIIQ